MFQKVDIVQCSYCDALYNIPCTATSRVIRANSMSKMITEHARLARSGSRSKRRGDQSLRLVYNYCTSTISESTIMLALGRKSFFRNSHQSLVRQFSNSVVLNDVDVNIAKHSAPSPVPSKCHLWAKYGISLQTSTDTIFTVMNVLRNNYGDLFKLTFFGKNDCQSHMHRFCNNSNRGFS